MSDNLIEIKNLNKDFMDPTGFKVHLLEDISLNIEEGKITSILSPKGSGKSTLLKIIAGLDQESENVNFNKGEDVIYIPSKSSSFPWLDVESNVTYNYEPDSGEDVAGIINLVGLDGYENHYPRNSSLGFRFRIVLARTLLRKPNLIIIDEAFNEMPSEIKDEIYALLLRIKHELSLSILLGTSNISEAVLLSDVIYLMDKNPGRIVERIESELDPDRSTEIIEHESFLTKRSEVERKIAEFNKNKFMDYYF